MHFCLRDYPAYLFDLDGTLVDSAPDIHAALNFTLSNSGHPTVEPAQTRDFVGMGSRALLRRALDHHGRQDVDHEPMLDTFLDYYERNIAVHSRPFPQTVETLAALHERGKGLAVVTNKYDRLTRRVLDELALSPYFSSIVCSDTVPHSKPAADPALVACAALGVAPNDALFVGDASPDVGCARAAGCDVVVVRDGYNNGIPAEDLGADAVINSLADILLNSHA
ncbi:MAG: phosphoglycolate phosphatase [Pseudomonadota bacterium]